MSEFSALPRPFTAPDCDVSEHRSMPFDIQRFRRSHLYITRSDKAFAAGFLLMAASWQSTPAASLLDDDRFLSYIAGYGPAVKRWMRVRDDALSDWTKCSDGRLYHADVAAVANDTWPGELLKRASRAQRDDRPVDAIAVAIRDTLVRVIDWDPPSGIVKRADAWLVRYERVAPDQAQRRAGAGQHALIKLSRGRS